MLWVFGVIRLTDAIAQIVSHESWWQGNLTVQILCLIVSCFSVGPSFPVPAQPVHCPVFTELFYQEEKEHDPNPTQPAQTLHTQKTVAVQSARLR